VPQDLFQFLGNLLAVRAWPGLDFVLFAVRDIYVKNAKRPPGFDDAVIQGLDRLQIETEYTTPNDPRSATIPYEAIPLCRYLAAKLAKQMAKSGFETKPAIAKWLELIPSDPLPEIRFIESEMSE
jgi:hypothetical protein